MNLEILVVDHPTDEASFAVEIWIDNDQLALVAFAPNNELMLTVYDSGAGERSLSLSAFQQALDLAAAELRGDRSQSRPEVNLEELLRDREMHENAERREDP